MVILVTSNPAVQPGKSSPAQAPFAPIAVGGPALRPPRNQRR